MRLLILLMLAGSALAAESLRVMTFNIWVGGEAGKQPLSQTAKVIEAAKADLVGIQEKHQPAGNGRPRVNSARLLAEMLRWHCFDQGDSTAVISRFPIVTNSPLKWGVAVRMPSGREVWHFNAHFSHAPYQPYQLLGIPYADAPFIKTAEEAVAAAQKARGAEIAGLVAEARPLIERGRVVFLTGDFNEPSHLDWTARAAQAGKVPLAVRYPTTAMAAEAGFKDTYRTIFPDESTKLGHTWTPTTKPNDPKDRHDRIDFVWATPNVKVIASQVVGEASEFADIVVGPYPSDHRAVVSVVELP